MAFVVVGQFAIRTETVAGVLAPEGSIVAVRDRRVPHGFHIQTFPAEITAAVHSDPGQSGPFTQIGVHYAARPAAIRARFTATCASFTLYPLSLRGVAPVVACLAASSATATLNVLPASN